MDPRPTEFLARPFVCGVLGEPTTEQLDRLRRSVPGLVPVHEAPGVRLLAARPLAAYRSEPRLTAWAFGDHAPSTAHDWRAAAIDTESPGLADLGDRVVLHAGALGLIDLFTRRLGESTWFASRMEPLLALDAAPLEVDWEAWASILRFHCPSGDMTPFRAIRRLQGARTVELERDTGRVRWDAWSPPWRGLDPVAPDAGDAGEVLDQLRTAMRRIEPVPHSIALSGGYDSRLIAIVARDAGIPMTAITTTKDDGRNDPEVAQEVAALLGVPYRYVDSARLPYASYGEQMRRRTEGMIAMNTWTAPLGEALRAQGRPVLTDMLGGVLFGGANISHAMETMPPGNERRLALMAMLQRLPVPGRTITEQAMPWVMDTAGERWLDAISHLAGDAHELQLAMIENRDARGIGALHHWGMGPEIRLEIPVSGPDMLRAAFSVGISRTMKARFSQELMRLADPVIGGHRTSHGPAARATGTHSLKGSAAGIAWIRADVQRACSVADLVPEGMLRYLELGRWAGPSRTDRLLRRRPAPRAGAFGGYRMAEMARLSLPIAHLGAWIETHRDRLASLDPPWRTRRRRPLP